LKKFSKDKSTIQDVIEILEHIQITEDTKLSGLVLSDFAVMLKKLQKHYGEVKGVEVFLKALCKK
jgi:hypothetical protein